MNSCSVLIENRTSKYLDIERALAKVQGALGISPREVADEIVKNCELSMFEWDKLKAKTEQIGYPIIAVVNQINANCRNGLGEFCHVGDHPGQHRHRHRAADPGRPGARRAGPGRDRRAGSAGAQVPRHAHLSCLYIHANISVARQHAAALIDAMVADHERSTRKEGKNVYYSVADPGLMQVLKAVYRTYCPKE